MCLIGSKYEMGSRRSMSASRSACDRKHGVQPSALPALNASPGTPPTGDGVGGGAMNQVYDCIWVTAALSAVDASRALTPGGVEGVREQVDLADRESAGALEVVAPLLGRGRQLGPRAAQVRLDE